MPRILTYNVHRCVGVDQRLDVGRVADVIAACAPDIVALQELDVGRSRTGGVDQAHELARRLGMSFHFHAALRVEEEQYGDAILTVLPERLIKAGRLPGLHPRVPLEPRGALWIEAEIGEARLQIINTHLGLAPGEQHRQARALISEEWLGRADCANPVILLGDFNAGPTSRTYQILSHKLTDARALSKARRAAATFPSRAPMLRIDHMFVSAGVRVTDLSAHATATSRKASDHLPLLMTFEI